MKLEDILKKRGFSEQEIQEMAPLLGNAKFRQSLEEEITALDEEAVKAKKEVADYDEWFMKELTPEHERLLKEKEDAVAEAAAAQARMKEYQNRTMRKAAGDPEPEPAKKTTDNPNDPRYVAKEEFVQAFDKVGDAIAVAQDIVADHAQLFPGQYLSMAQLRDEAKKARKPIRQYYDEKFKVADRREQIRQETERKKEEEIEKKVTEKLMAQFAGSNPGLATLKPSNNHLVIKKSAGTQGKQPWEVSENELKKARVEKAIQAAVKRGDLASV